MSNECRECHEILLATQRALRLECGQPIPGDLPDVWTKTKYGYEYREAADVARDRESRWGWCWYVDTILKLREGRADTAAEAIDAADAVLREGGDA